MADNHENDEIPISSHSEPNIPKYNKGLNLLKMAGWTGGALGKNKDGIIEPIKAQDNIGRTGLGMTSKTGCIPGSYDGKHKIHPDRLKSVSVRNKDKNPIVWLKWQLPYDPTFKFDDALTKGKETFNYDLYCDDSLVQKLFEAKDKLDSVDSPTFLKARTKANPYEIIGKSIFINRAAVKMANLDYLCNTLVPREQGKKFYFCDVCAGPGGFTEYILWKRYKFDTKGWGMTLHGNDDWKFHRFNPLSDVNGRFTACYGVDNTGNVYKSENIKSFQNIVLKGTEGKGVHLFTADGGFCVSGNENYQEVELKRLILDQFLCMFCVLAKGGNFVCKIFDTFTPFTVGLLYILHRHFEKFAIVKPITSRPANSERYVVCKNFLEQKPSVINYLFLINEHFDSKSNDEDIIDIVDPKLIKSDNFFYHYIREMNVKIINAQIAALEDLVLYIEDTLLLPYANQKTIEDYALQLWKIPPRPPYIPHKNRGRGNYRGRYNNNRGNYRGNYRGNTKGVRNNNPITNIGKKRKFHSPTGNIEEPLKKKVKIQENSIQSPPCIDQPITTNYSREIEDKPRSKFKLTPKTLAALHKATVKEEIK